MSRNLKEKKFIPEGMYALQIANEKPFLRHVLSMQQFILTEVSLGEPLASLRRYLSAKGHMTSEARVLARLLKSC